MLFFGKTKPGGRVDLRQLRYFVAIVQSGSISRASLQLNIAQPALSLHIRNMEADLGVPLLFRTPQGVQPTEAGLILLRNAKTILAQFEQTEREIRGSSTEPTGEVRLGLPGTISQILGAPLVIAARERYPKITLRIAEAMSGYVLEWLRLGRVDLGLLFQTVEDRDLRSIALATETLVLFGPARAQGRHDASARGRAGAVRDDRRPAAHPAEPRSRPSRSHRPTRRPAASAGPHRH